MKKILKRLLLALGVLLLLFIGTAFAIPYFFKDQILSKANIAKLDQAMKAKEAELMEV